MTGYGKATLVANNKKITVEIKSLNSKQMDLSVKLPLPYRDIELELRNLIAQELGRGKVDVFISSESIETGAVAVVNEQLIKAYKSQVEQLSRDLAIPEPCDWYATLFRMPDVFKLDVSQVEVEQEELNAVKSAVQQALDGLNEFRSQEGEKLYHFFKEKINAIQQKTTKELKEMKERENITLVPLKVYFKNSHAKLLLGVCKGKKLYDKRETIKQRDLDREARRH